MNDWVAIAKGVIKRHGDILFIVIQLDLNILNDLEERKIKARYADKAVIVLALKLFLGYSS